MSGREGVLVLKYSRRGGGAWKEPGAPLKAREREAGALIEP